MSDRVTDPMAEIAAMKTVAEALAKLDAAATTRVLQWAANRFGVIVGATSNRADRTREKPVGDALTDNATFSSLADLYAATTPSTDADRALVTGYWYQFNENQEDFAAQTINSALKNLGHGVSNITKALETLKAQSPALVMQVRKSGTSQQARKKYKLTAAGKKAVELLVEQG